jgi:hypothetical protein
MNIIGDLTKQLFDDWDEYKGKNNSCLENITLIEKRLYLKNEKIISHKNNIQWKE